VHEPADPNDTTFDPSIEHVPEAVNVTVPSPVAVATGVYVSPTSGLAGTPEVNTTSRSAFPIANVSDSVDEARKFASPARDADTTHDVIPDSSDDNNLVSGSNTQSPDTNELNVTSPEPDPPDADTTIDPPNRNTSEPVIDNDA